MDSRLPLIAPSLPPTQATSLASPLSRFDGRNFMIHCAICATLRQLAVGDVMKVRGAVGLPWRNLLVRRWL